VSLVVSFSFWSVLSDCPQVETRAQFVNRFSIPGYHRFLSSADLPVSCVPLIGKRHDPVYIFQFDTGNWITTHVRQQTEVIYKPF
jgi:hypothetical protein